MHLRLNCIATNTQNKYQQYLDPQLLWDMCKLDIAESAKHYSKARARRKKQAENNITEKLTNVQALLSETPDSEILRKEYQKLQREQEIHLIDQARGAQIRSKIKWIEQGERNTGFFLGLETSRAKKKMINALTTPQGKTLTSQNEIGKELLRHFKQFYSSNNRCKKDEYDAYIDGVAHPRLSADKRQDCEGLFTVSECAKAVQKMSNTSSPGPDGLGAAFYKVFWNQVGELVCQSLNYAHSTANTLSVSQRKAIITLLHKGEHLSKDQIGNYRPLSLNNVDYYK